MSIQTISEAEQLLATALRNTTDVLKQVTAERDKLAAELKTLRNSGVELPEKAVINTHIPTGINIYGYTESQLRDYGDRRAMAEREREAKVCESTHANGNRKYTHADECAEAIRKGETA